MVWVCLTPGFLCHNFAWGYDVARCADFVLLSVPASRCTPAGEGIWLWHQLGTSRALLDYLWISVAFYFDFLGKEKGEYILSPRYGTGLQLSEDYWVIYRDYPSGMEFYDEWGFFKTQKQTFLYDFRKATLERQMTRTPVGSFAIWRRY